MDQCVRTRERWPGKTPKETTVGFRGETGAADLVARHLDLEQAVHLDMESAERERARPHPTAGYRDAEGVWHICSSSGERRLADGLEANLVQRTAAASPLRRHCRSTRGAEPICWCAQS